MADQRRDPTSGPRRTPCSKRRARGEARGKLEDLSRRRARRRQDLRDAAAAHAPARRTASTSSSASSRPMAARRPRRCSKGLEIVPRRRIEYKGQWLEEMDLDAIIARRPQLVLVDELAHTNAPGSRHPEALSRCRGAAGRAASTSTRRSTSSTSKASTTSSRRSPHVRVRETVPDRSVRPRRRRRAGRSDARRSDPAAARRARSTCRSRPSARSSISSRPANLTALRELALRRTAERVDEQLLTDMQAHAIPGPGPRASACWSASARTRAAPDLCATPSASPTGCMRRGRRSMSRAGARLQLTEEERDRIADTLRLAERSAARPSRCRRATDASPTTSSATPRRTTSPRS